MAAWLGEVVKGLAGSVWKLFERGKKERASTIHTTASSGGVAVSAGDHSTVNVSEASRPTVDARQAVIDRARKLSDEVGSYLEGIGSAALQFGPYGWAEKVRSCEALLARLNALVGELWTACTSESAGELENMVRATDDSLRRADSQLQSLGGGRFRLGDDMGQIRSVLSMVEQGLRTTAHNLRNAAKRLQPRP